ncbi:helix-turn-helix transcriptional regulator [Sphingomonas sp. ASV193]|uniref:helix-turn-helix domain-containing protein n=1 Tax=Sphingomonas sp. ASV193 TaxID=3144405 RepID=UPI0032E8D625
MDEEIAGEADAVPTVGERLREAREAKGLSLAEIASSTRIPVRHLESIETGEWDRLPAQTYSIGFARNYASAVGLDRTEIGDQLRMEMGGYRPASAAQASVFEPVDPKRQMPKGLVLGALVALAIVVGLLAWLSNRETSGGIDETVAADNSAAPVVPAPAPAPAAANAVTVAATEAAWVEIKDGATILKQGELKAGEVFAVPASAANPVLSTAKPEALTIKVGTEVAPSIGPAGKRVSDVSLKPEALLKPAAAASNPAPAPATAKPVAKPKPKPKPVAASPAPAASDTAPATATPPPAATTTNSN